MRDFGEEGMQMPHEPDIKVYGIIPDNCRVFASAVRPMKLDFNARIFPPEWTENDPMPEMEKYSAVVKNGDDMRQD